MNREKYAPQNVAIGAKPFGFSAESIGSDSIDVSRGTERRQEWSHRASALNVDAFGAICTRPLRSHTRYVSRLTNTAKEHDPDTYDVAIGAKPFGEPAEPLSADSLRVALELRIVPAKSCLPILPGQTTELRLSVKSRSKTTKQTHTELGMFHRTPPTSFLFLAFTVIATFASAQSEFSSQPFEEHLLPFLKTHCIYCHNIDQRESGIRLDHFDGTLPDDRINILESAREQLISGAMPPDDEPQPSQKLRTTTIEQIDAALRFARTRQAERHGTIRRQTVRQLQYSLQELLFIKEDFTRMLPPDGISKDGFRNDASTLSTSPIQVETIFEIARRAVDAAIVDPATKPTIQNFRIKFGKLINTEPLPERLILGANSHLLPNSDFVVEELTPNKPFEFEPFRMRKEYRFHEGYQGNSTVRGWRDYDSIYHSVFACVRGSSGYPIGKPFEVIDEGLLLRPAIPNASIWRESGTYGPKANFKIALRELPNHGKFKVTVIASGYDDVLLLKPNEAKAIPIAESDSSADQLVFDDFETPQDFKIKTPGVYQLDVYKRALKDGEKNRNIDLRVKIDGKTVTSQLNSTPFLAVRFNAGQTQLKIEAGKENDRIERVVLSHIDDSTETAKEFHWFVQQRPHVGVHMGLRRDCGHTFDRVGEPQAVTSTHPNFQPTSFISDINNFPRPRAQADNDNYLAGVREILVHHEYTDGRDRPRLLIHSIEFEGPYYESWPPISHRRNIFPSPHKGETEHFARLVLKQFATRAFRRPATEQEIDSFVNVWRTSTDEDKPFHECIKDAMVVVLTSPQFLFISEKSEGPQAENLNQWELASKLSFFLTNGPPDVALLDHAKSGTLDSAIHEQVDRLIEDKKFHRFADEFASGWLNLDKFDVVETDRQKFPELIPHVKRHLRTEPARWIEYLIRHNRPARELIDSDYIFANETIANYYGLGDHCRSGFRFTEIECKDTNLGGLLAQAALLAGLSDGREPNPVKRGAFLAKKIIAKPPDDPPPNIPELSDDTSLPLRERLEKHRNVKACAKCHQGIDPYGFPLEGFDAGGRYQNENIDASSTLPDGTTIKDFNDFRRYLSKDEIDQVAFSFLKHLATYAIGRQLTYNESRKLKQDGLELNSQEYGMKDMIHFIVDQDFFRKK